MSCLLACTCLSLAVAGTGETTAVPSPLEPTVILLVRAGVVVLVMGIILCLYRILRGPHLADRVLAADTLSLQVVGLVIMLAIRLRTTAYFDVALVVAIIGFASTIAFAQFIAARGVMQENL